MEVIIRLDEEHKRQQKQARPPPRDRHRAEPQPLRRRVRVRYTRVRGVQAREAAAKHTVADTAIAATAGSRDNSPNVDESGRFSATTRTRRRWRFSLRGRRSRRAKTGPHDDAIYLPARFINAKRFVAILQASVISLRFSALISAHTPIAPAGGRHVVRPARRVRDRPAPRHSHRLPRCIRRRLEDL